MLNITKNYSTGYNISNRGAYKPQWIVIHYFGSLGSAMASSNYFKAGNRNASADFFVDDDSIIQFNPDIQAIYTWHCGGGLQGIIRHRKYGICKNCNSIGIEMRPYNDRGSVSAAQNAGWYFHQATVKNTADLVINLMDKYHIDLEHVIMHADVTGKYCPAPFLDRPEEWSAFLGMLQAKETPAPTDPAKENNNENTMAQIVTVNTDVLNVRQSPTTESSIVTTIGKGEKYTIVEKSSDKQWGKLKSGAGWISLDFVVADSIFNETEYPCPVIVQVTTDILNVRKGPGTDYPIVMTVGIGEKYTVTETVNGFGKLKSGAGYISMQYVKLAD